MAQRQGSQLFWTDDRQHSAARGGTAAGEGAGPWWLEVCTVLPGNLRLEVLDPRTSVNGLRGSGDRKYKPPKEIVFFVQARLQAPYVCAVTELLSKVPIKGSGLMYRIPLNTKNVALGSGANTLMNTAKYYLEKRNVNPDSVKGIGLIRNGDSGMTVQEAKSINVDAPAVVCFCLIPRAWQRGATVAGR
jgi:hypothetical protein